jgi:hypothetical protein
MYLHTHSPNVFTPFRPVSSQGHVTVRAMHLLGFISVSIEGIPSRSNIFGQSQSTASDIL